MDMKIIRVLFTGFRFTPRARTSQTRKPCFPVHARIIQIRTELIHGCSWQCRVSYAGVSQTVPRWRDLEGCGDQGYSTESATLLLGKFVLFAYSS